MIRRNLVSGGFAGFLFNVPFGPRPALDNPENLGAQVMERLDDNHREVKTVLGRVEQKQGQTDTAIGEVKSRLDSFDSRLSDAEQKAARRGSNPGAPLEKTWGETLIEAPEFKSLSSSASQRGKAAVQVKALTMTSATNSNAALVAPDYRPDPVMLPRRRLTVRDLISPGTTAGNSVMYPRQTIRNLNAANVAETLLKPQSDIEFEMVTAPVQTTAHWMLCSRQIMDDAQQLKSIIDTEMRYGLDLVEEAQFLYGDGTGANFLGMVPQATPYSGAFTVTGETPIDRLSLALNQSELALLPATGIVLHPSDWRKILLVKDGMGRYIVGDPLGQTAPNLWGVPVVATLAMQPNKFLVGAFRDAAQVYDRMEAEVLISSEDSDNFRKNLVTVRAERRAAMTVRRPQALIYGSLEGA